MNAALRAQEEKRAKAAARKAANTKGSSRREHRNPLAATMDIAACDSVVFMRAFAAVLAAGNAMMLGYTSDGGCLVMTILEDGERIKEYIQPSEDLTEVFKGVAEDYE